MTQRTAAISFLGALLLAGCGSSDSAPASSTPTAVATPTPAPSPSPSVAAFRCHLPAMPALGKTCPKVQAQLGEQVNKAIDNVMAQRPELFDFNDFRGSSIKVLDRDKYQAAVVNAINALGGVCAKDDNEEVAVKISNDFNEQWAVWAGTGYTRRSYVTTCFPAEF